MAIEMAGSRLNVFVCFRRSDGTEAAKALVHHLLRKGYAAFADLPDERLKLSHSEINRRLAAADVVLFVDTPDAATSPWIVEELRETLKNGRLLIWMRIGVDENRKPLPPDIERKPDYLCPALGIGTAQLAFIDRELAKRADVGLVPAPRVTGAG